MLVFHMFGTIVGRLSLAAQTIYFRCRFVLLPSRAVPEMRASRRCGGDEPTLTSAEPCAPRTS